MAKFLIVEPFDYLDANKAIKHVAPTNTPDPRNIFDSLDQYRFVGWNWAPPVWGLEAMDQRSYISLEILRLRYRRRGLRGGRKIPEMHMYTGNGFSYSHKLFGRYPPPIIEGELPEASFEIVHSFTYTDASGNERHVEYSKHPHAPRIFDTRDGHWNLPPDFKLPLICLRPLCQVAYNWLEQTYRPHVGKTIPGVGVVPLMRIVTHD